MYIYHYHHTYSENVGPSEGAHGNSVTLYKCVTIEIKGGLGVQILKKFL